MAETVLGRIAETVLDVAMKWVVEMAMEKRKLRVAVRTAKWMKEIVVEMLMKDLWRWRGGAYCLWSYHMKRL